MPDQNRTALDTSGLWPLLDPEPRADPVRGPGIVAVDGRGLIASWNGAASTLLSNAGPLLALEQPFGQLEMEARRSCGVSFIRHPMADGGLVCLCEPMPVVAAPFPNLGPNLAPTVSAQAAASLPFTSGAGHATGQDALARITSSFAFLRNPLPLWIFDRGTLAFVAVNDAALARYGYSRDRFLDMRISDIRPSEDVPRLLESLTERGDHGETGQWRHRKADGGVIDVLVTSEWFTMDGRSLCMTAAQDITNHCRLEDSLLEARIEAERANRARSRFFAVANHDLRQPLAALSLFVGALENRLKDPTSRDILRAMNTALATIKNLVDAHLDIARIDAGTLRVEPVGHSVNGLLTRMALEFAGPARQKGLTLHVAPCSAVIRSDRDLLERILRNLLSNAVRYTSSGRILVGCRRQGDRLRIEVWDTGPGIPADQLDIIFEEFYRGNTPSTSDQAGFGLGLSIVDRLSRLLDHSMSVRSREGKGSVFAITVPMEGESELRPDPVRLPARPNDTSRPRVLVIEDDVIVLQALELLLDQWGCDVTAASGYDEAVKEVASDTGPLDLVIADFRLSGPASGIVAIRQIAKMLDTDLPGLIITGDTDPRCLKEARLSGYSLLHKPVSALALRAAVANLLGRERLRDGVA
ncbi:ATP-binding response regulator [Skermanella stibiiresistens]|uniref:ATP-binding response regulator n=1 Tax=Skermanella stibiiresistens TaxID=913326 RepID=UPI000A001158|nr:ATP-binding protein [Skermanella stibiiresistens]